MRSFLALVATFLLSLTASALDFPPSPRVLLAVNPMTNKVYALNESAGTVTVLDAANATTKTITVGSRPQFVVLNPLTNRIYVNNGGDATISVIDGGTDTNLTPTPLAVGSQGPMAINAETNVVYIVRMSSVATDEVTFLNGADNTWYTIATESFQPTALSIDPSSNTLYVAHYGTGDVRLISGAWDPSNVHPTTFSIPAWSHPFAIAATAGNRAFVITEDSRGPIGIIDRNTRTADWPLPAPGHAQGPKAIAFNPVTNKAYAVFSGEVIVIDGMNANAYTYIPMDTGTAAAGVAINHITNKIYVAGNSGTLAIIDGFTNAVSTVTVPAGAESIAVNPVTNEAIVHGPTPTFVDGAASSGEGSLINTQITPLSGNSSGPNPTITMTATNSMNSLPIRGIFYQLDSREGAWAPGLPGSGGSYTASFTGLPSGSHTLNAFAVTSEVASIATGPEAAPLVGLIASYAFTVSSSSSATVSFASSTNPSSVGQAVIFTASVTGSGAAPTGTVTFRDGTTALCPNVALASGAASCTTSALASGPHTINASYSGDSSYASASASLTQTVNKLASTVTVGSTPNPSTAGQSVTISASVTGGSGTPTGTVSFLDGTSTLCSAVTLASGSATCTTSSLSTGARTLTANYSGNATYNLSSGSTTQNVGTAPATVAVASSMNPSSAGQSVTFTASVSGSGATPTGTVNFTDAATTLCSAVSLSAGSASCTTNTLAVGSHTITASFSGSATYGAASATVTQAVNKINPTVMGSASPSPADTGVAVMLTADLSGSAGAPTGTVDFLDGSTAIADCSARPVSGDRATCTVSNLAAGSHSLAARYSGNATYNGMTSAAFSLTITCNNCPPAPPIQSSPSGTIATQAPVYTWAASAGATGYWLLVQNLNGVAVNMAVTPSQAGCSAGGTCSFNPNAMLPNGSTWGWYLKASNANGESSWSSGMVFNVNAPGPIPPSRPTGISPSGDVTTSRPTYAWNDVAGALAYTLLVQNLNGVAVNVTITRAQANCGTTCSFTPDSALPGGTTWGFYVKAANSIGESAWSDGLIFKVNVTGPSVPPAPVQSSPSGTVTTNTPTYQWSASGGATSYWLLVQNLDGVAVNRAVSPMEAGCANGGTCTLTPSASLPNQTMWGWYVKAANDLGESAWSSGMTFTVNAAGPSAPAAPTQVSPSGNIATTMPTYTWNASAGATSYYIVVQNLDSVAVNITLSASSVGCGSGMGTCSYMPSQSLPSNTVWGWYVRAINDVGASGYSAGMQFTTP